MSHIDILAPQLENFIQDNFPDISDENISGTARLLVEIVLTEYNALVLKQKQEALKKEQTVDSKHFKKTYEQMARQWNSESAREMHSNERRSTRPSSIRA
jgi:hypothetical protein